ncbi:polysaccharide deacetylase family protein [Sphingobium sp.]|uniref:polysaccharide deacetylase family protein n=1 Tax=Sphingobium sp. TaxID=1912891 RepID=UPI0035C731E4
MSLDPSYLTYPRRAQGMDHDLYAWSHFFERPPIVWPDGKSVAIWPVISLEWFPILPADRPFRAPGHMQTAYPDYRHYTAREYGTRVGFYRLLDAFEKVGARISVACNGAVAERYPQLVADIVAGGHEIIAHSTDMNGTIDSSLAEDEERLVIARSLAMIEQASGQRPRGWLSIARSQSFATPRLLAEASLSYMCDWVHDELPVRFDTPAGGIVNMPLNHELSDRQIINVQQQSVDSYAVQMQDAYRWLAEEAQSHGGRMMPMHLTPYIMGLPYRMDAFDALVQWLAEQPGAWFATGSQIVEQSGI